MTSPVLLDFAEGVATLTLNRPDVLNALSVEMMKALADAVAQLSRRGDYRVVVLQGAGAHFMAGGDLQEFSAALNLSPESRLVNFRALIEQYINPVVEGLQALPVPVVGRVQGACVGFGLSLVLGCDLVLAEEQACFSTAYAGIGVSGDGGVSWFLPRIVGRRKALELLLLADRIDARQALSLGIVNRVVATGHLDAAVSALIDQLKAGCRRTQAEIKALLNQSPDQSLPAQLQLEGEAFARCTSRPGFDEGVRAFLARRKPEFRD
ncbi:enoyl-CoA hydratase-related protein [Zoogloea sp.]|uniref:enoyl-CoA hydratase/isomerase family protein n=1 Tax=Zoogloea sp. TaxID=49181 RepID=UPI002622EDBD|nr:enoyl-CoA hydratase-related protein [Zoogloea sp.]MDD3353425.1 enoyl-CoA hydratase-related protein [Zoogloea sp.]